MDSQKEKTPFDQLGQNKLYRIIDRFYELVSQHPEISPLFPEDLTDTARKQKQFLTQFLGGPPLYTEEHGHPMLRARHMPFQITPTGARAWLACMEQTLEENHVDDPLKSQIFSRLTYTAKHMVNTQE